MALGSSSVAHRRAIVKSWEASGLSAAEFARLTGERQWALYSWRRQLRRERGRPRSGAEAAFVEIIPATEVPAPSPMPASPVRSAEIELVLSGSGVGATAGGDELVLRVPRGFDAATLRRVVDALRPLGPGDE